MNHRFGVTDDNRTEVTVFGDSSEVSDDFRVNQYLVGIGCSAYTFESRYEGEDVTSHTYVL